VRSEHKHCDSAATNASNAKAISRMEASSAGKMSQVLGAFGLLDSPCYVPFLLGRCFETYEPFIYFIFLFFFSGRGEPRILNKRKRGTPVYIECKDKVNFTVEQV
jgi:hypothetical protein